jgi:hypothetical protein
VVLTEAEEASLAAVAGGEKRAAVEPFIAALAKSRDARFRMEAVRWFFHREREEIGALRPALERRIAELGDAAAPQDRFDLALATIMDDWQGDGARGAVCTLSEIADESGDPAHLICAAEALDLVAHDDGDAARHYASRLALAHVRRATVSLLAPSGDAQTLRLLGEHLPYLKGMHAREPGWAKLFATIEKG